MDYTESQKVEFKDQYAERRKRQIGFSIVFVLVLLPIAIASERVSWFPFLMIAVIVPGIVFSLRNWRCPACGGYLGRSFNPKFCQKCGVQLRS